MKRDPHKTARCVLQYDNEYLLAVHSSFWAKKNQRWGLPGGRIERGETAREAVQRELEEELELYHTNYIEVAPYRYKGAKHMVFGATIPQRITEYDEGELLDLRWFTLDQLRELERTNQLHAGYELSAIKQYIELPKPV